MSQFAALNRGLILELPAQLDWQALVVSPMVDGDSVSAYLSFEPCFPHCAVPLFARNIVLDIRALIDSAVRPGGYFILSCTCGYAEHAGLNDAVYVAHPTADQITWELDIERLAPALDGTLQGPGFLRLVFEREAYVGSIQRLLAAARDLAARPQPLDRCHQQDRLDTIRAGSTLAGNTLIVDGIEPDFDGDESLDRLLAATSNIDWTPRWMVMPGSQIDIGLFDAQPWQVTGDQAPACIADWFTRHAVARAWDVWDVWSWIDRKPADEQNMSILAQDADPQHFMVERGADAAAFHRRGQRFAELLQASLAESHTSPGTQLRYVGQGSP